VFSAKTLFKESSPNYHTSYLSFVTINSAIRDEIWWGRENEMQKDKIQCCKEQRNHAGLFNLMVKISGTPVSDLIEPSP
jgi:hypothetical protein